ncbi:CHAT domain-containing protein [Dasania sp. GY-MA-18]|uniref:CHAT domain-containing protein n=1 Tax=Dasania phycosphaerae TaxID=2950436 RepID=A0A9J6RNS9_9GAMM|nr:MULTISPECIES: CHAT domain-containing protein [Dasania]MCR8923359.1 CHAT domain-containing protein [Dasania sp. GY-MA-18]MCZ0865791.1 CHAT domain-containing protein [Dasania phycosphaerae]MCZ0869516.1 CHAT domain-containing protein [Dasania phycosphaerae]
MKKALLLASFLPLLTAASVSLAAPYPALLSDDTDEAMMAPTELHYEGQLQALTQRYQPRDLSDQITRLDALCHAHLSLGHYSQFYDCMAVWQRSSFALTLGLMRKHNQYPEYASYARAGQPLIAETPYTTALFPQEVEARKHRLLAEAWFQLGQYTQALDHANSALKNYYELGEQQWQAPSQRSDLSFMYVYAGGPQPDNQGKRSSDDYALPGGNEKFHWSYDILMSATLAAQSEIRLGRPQLAAEHIKTITRLHKTSDGGDIHNSFQRARQYYLNTVLFELGDYQHMRPMTISASEIGQTLMGYFAVGSSAVLAVGDFVTALSGFNSNGAFAKMAGFSANYGLDALTERLFTGLQFREQLQLALIAANNKDWALSLKHANNILNDGDSASFSEIRWLSAYQKGYALEQQGQLAAALQAYELAMQLVENSRGNISVESQKIGFVGDKASAYQRAIALLIKLGRDEQAFVTAERARSRALVDMLADSQARREQLPNSISLAPLAFNPQPAATAATSTGLRGLKNSRRDRAAIKQIETQSLTTVTPFNAQELQALLSPTQVLVEYLELDDQWYAFKVTANNIQTLKLNAAQLNLRISDYRKQLQNKNSQRYKQLSQQLYQELISPLQLNDHAELTIVASGALHYLPFASLHSGQQFLIEQRAISHLPSASVAAFLNRDSANKQHSLLAMGNPTVDLPGAEQEVKRIATLINNSAIVTQQQATETLLKQQGQQYGILHIASHGEFNSRRAQQSRLLLAKDASNDGELTMGEVYQLQLNASLVVLSACETGLGSLANGDEVIGLTRGFLYAGSDNIIASLWKVDDSGTQQLMNLFYQGISQQNYGQALRSAQQQMINSSNNHPFYWAAFQLTGQG